jgi:hypothetical protein
VLKQLDAQPEGRPFGGESMGKESGQADTCAAGGGFWYASYRMAANAVVEIDAVVTIS